MYEESMLSVFFLAVKNELRDIPRTWGRCHAVYTYVLLRN